MSETVGENPESAGARTFLSAFVLAALMADKNVRAPARQFNRTQEFKPVALNPATA